MVAPVKLDDVLAAVITGAGVSTLTYPVAVLSSTDTPGI